MNNKRAICWVIIIIVVLIGTAIYTNKKADKIEFSQERQQAIEDAIQRPTITINTKHQFKDGQHVFLGTLEVPTPCHTHNAEVITHDISGITEIALSYSTEAETCTQVIEERQFKVTFSGSGDEEIIATLNGEAVNFNVFEVGPDEDISKVEIFIKG